MQNFDLTALPKITLHDHLDGGLRPTTLLDLATSAGVSLPADTAAGVADEIARRAGGGSLPGYLETFGWTVAVMQSAHALQRIAYEAVLDLAADGVVLAELRFAPLLHTAGGLTPQQAIDAVLNGIEKGTQETGVPVGVILCSLRHRNEAAQVVDLFESNWTKDGLVVGVDLAGPEAGFPVSDHPAFAELAQRWPAAPITLHAGEAAGIESIRAAVEAGAKRIGHGTRLIDDIVADRDLLALVKERGILLEVCLTSNHQTGAADSIETHPLREFLREGVRVNIDVDNRLVSGTSQSREMGLAQHHFALSPEIAHQMALDALSASFMPQWAKLIAATRLGTGPKRASQP